MRNSQYTHFVAVRSLPFQIRIFRRFLAVGHRRRHTASEWFQVLTDAIFVAHAHIHHTHTRTHTNTH